MQTCYDVNWFSAQFQWMGEILNSLRRVAPIKIHTKSMESSHTCVIFGEQTIQHM